MILRELDQYLHLHRRATLGDIALHFDLPAEAARGMLDLWIRKGRIRQLDAAATCNMSCPVSCDDSAMTIYEAVTERPRAHGRSMTLLPLMTPEPASCRHGGPATLTPRSRR